MKKQQQFVLKECGKDFDNRNLLSLTHTQTTHLISFFENKIRKKNQKLFVTTTLHTHLSLFMLYVDIGRPRTTVGVGRAPVRSHHYVFTEKIKEKNIFEPKCAARGWPKRKQKASMNF